jgi:hypothetical protein
MGSLYGYEIDSDLPLARLSQAPGELGSITVRAELGRPLEASAELTRLIVEPDLSPRYAAGRLDSRILTWHPDAGTFLIDPGSMAISHRVADSSEELGPERWEDRLSSTAIPLLLGKAGGQPLHAAANLVDGRAVVICGVTGRGKSTLSAALAAAGHPSLGEDGVVVLRSGSGHEAWPGPTGSLITEAAAARIGTSADGGSDPRGRRLHTELRCATGPGPVALIAFLRERGGSAVSIERVDSAKTHRELIDHLLAVDPLDAGRFAELAGVAESAEGVLLRVPDSLDAALEAAEQLAGIARET